MTQSVLKTLTFIAALTVAAPMLATAGDAPAGKRGPRDAGKGMMGERFNEVLSKLDLTEEQKTKIDAQKAKFREYMEANKEKFKAAREGSDEQKAELRKSVGEKMKEMMEGIRGVLTDDQKKKFAELMPAREGDGKGRRRGKEGDKK
jgi:Spy/CpxP family protein refolding chaperone